jgi:hypothetical protein
MLETRVIFFKNSHAEFNEQPLELLRTRISLLNIENTHGKLVIHEKNFIHCKNHIANMRASDMHGTIFVHAAVALHRVRAAILEN